MANKKENIDCINHGSSWATYVCTHIASSKDDEAVGFYQSHIDLYDDDYSYDAWCSDCDKKLQEAGNEWNDSLEEQADIKMVCFECFNHYKKKQLTLNPADMSISYIPGNRDIDGFYDMADDHISLANKNYKKNELANVSESFMFGAARYSAFEAIQIAKDIEKDKSSVIQYYSNRFKEMFIDHLEDYTENKDEYFKEKS